MMLVAICQTCTQ